MKRDADYWPKNPDGEVPPFWWYCFVRGWKGWAFQATCIWLPLVLVWTHDWPKWTWLWPILVSWGYIAFVIRRMIRTYKRGKENDRRHLEKMAEIQARIDEFDRMMEERRRAARWN